MSVIKIANRPAVLPQQISFLTADAASGVSTFTVKNILGFAVDQILLIGELGHEGSEIVKTSSSTAPSGSTITLTTTTSLPHYQGDKVYLMLYDQVEFSSAATIAGAKTALTTRNLWPDSPTTEYIDTAGTTGYYFGRYKNTISSTFSAYSDAMLVAGWATHTVGYIVNREIGRA